MHFPKAPFSSASPAFLSIQGLRLLGTALLCVLLFSSSQAIADQVENAPPPIIDVYTMGPGDHFTEKFGHAAICVRWPDLKAPSTCYNYGTTNFEDPVGLVSGFFRGRMRFWVSTLTAGEMVQFYRARDRDIFVQRLQLSPRQAYAIADKLGSDAVGDNKYFWYHHYLDNCSTRVRDIIDSGTDGALQASSDKDTGITFRTLTRLGFADLAPVGGLSDFMLARPADREISQWESMFLPRYLRAAIQEKLGTEAKQIYKRKGPKAPQSLPLLRFWIVVFSLLLCLPLWFFFLRNKRVRIIPTLVAFVPLFILTLLIWAYALLNTDPMARHNEALLLYCPLDLALFFLKGKIRHRYAQARVVIVLLATTLSLVGILHQPLWVISVLPIFFLLPFALSGSDSNEAHNSANSSQADPATPKSRTEEANE